MIVHTPRRFAFMVDRARPNAADRFTQWLNSQDDVRYWHYFRDSWLVVDHANPARDVDDWHKILEQYFAPGPFLVIRVADNAMDVKAAAGLMREDSAPWFNQFWFGDHK